MPKLKINGRELEPRDGMTILQTALENGIYIPHFCYHPHLKISGNCRMCLVDVKPGPPKLSIACATTVAEGMEVETENDKVRAARRAVMEFLLKNHPVDCPICDQAGECRLQDYYMAYDLQPSRILGPQEKVKKRKARRMGNTLVLDSERCVLCTRCIRFMRDVAGDECLVIAHRRDRAEVTAFPGRTVDNPYSLCLVDVCPVGAWTSADFRFKQRVWFLESSPSICPLCARGCNTWIDHRRGEVYRIRPRLNEAINKSWVCDRGRLAYHALNDHRLLAPALRQGGSQAPVSWDRAVDQAREIIKNAGANLVVVVSGSLSQEEGRAVVSLFKDRLGSRVLLNPGPPGPEDNLLRRADQNANTHGLTGLGITDKLDAGLAPESVVVLLETLGCHSLPEGVPLPRIVISPLLSSVSRAAEAALPAASLAESAGTVVNFEGAAQTYAPALPPPGQALPHLEILTRLARALGQKQVA